MIFLLSVAFVINEFHFSKFCFLCKYLSKNKLLKHNVFILFFYQNCIIQSYLHTLYIYVWMSTFLKKNRL